ncbi:hexitol phosphatase HxpB [Flavobacterium sediminis]|uniref:Hexitol phosphatase HxpB n=1 Tax=Flavobacterium sediminis TaxID=2201181 RepID=A0A2U8QVX3_9FLAO|nr:hexitol phosphatase HxpB [Flavobacterium sediminis]AWM14350.1 hexitol phosphatase HxpB [Flavobacterium sediminis]
MNRKDNKAVIFDMDGVIIDTENIWKQAEEEVFSSLGVKVSEAYTKITQSMTTAEVTQFWYEKFPWQQTSLQEVEQRVVSRVVELIQSETCLIKGVKVFIERLKSENYKIGLATNSPYAIIPIVLEKLKITHLFDTISSAEFEKNGKPDPAIYITTAKKLGVKPKNCFVIEDSYSGMLAAKNAGMSVAAFTNGNRNVTFEIADCSINSFEEDKVTIIIQFLR